jgi:hypothetical protein
VQEKVRIELIQRHIAAADTPYQPTVQ